MDRPRIRDLGIDIGEYPPGTDNTLLDLSGVKIGHTTLIKDIERKQEQKAIRTGVTAIFPHSRNIYLEKVPAAAKVINGYGKTIGIPQIQELGEIETPILLTNTLDVWNVADTLVSYMLATTEKEIHSINPVVGECNDGFLNHIQTRYITPDHVWKALTSATIDSREGVVGAGVGMTAFGLKGGIGMASRVLSLDERTYKLGVLVLSNFGKLTRLRIKGVPVGKRLDRKIDANPSKKHGSIMVIIGTNAPLTYRQLNRVLNRIPHGLSRVGSVSHHGSGDFGLGFLTREQKGKVVEEEAMSTFFEATVEAVAEAIINSLLKAKTVTGRDGNTSRAIPIEELKEIMSEFRVI